MTGLARSCGTENHNLSGFRGYYLILELPKILHHHPADF